MRHFFILFILGIFLTGCKDKKDQIACLESDKLRIQIGKTIFAFPRVDISSVKTTELTQSQYDEEHVSGKEVCNEGEKLRLSYVGIEPNIVPILCNKDECLKKTKHGSELRGSIIPILDIPKYIRKEQKPQKEYIQECKEKPYFNTCKYYVHYKDLNFGFQYYLSSFPLKDIQVTEQLVLDYLKQHDITTQYSNLGENE